MGRSQPDRPQKQLRHWIPSRHLGQGCLVLQHTRPRASFGGPSAVSQAAKRRSPSGSQTSNSLLRSARRTCFASRCAPGSSRIGALSLLVCPHAVSRPLVDTQEEFGRGQPPAKAASPEPTKVNVLRKIRVVSVLRLTEVPRRPSLAVDTAMWLRPESPSPCTPGRGGFRESSDPSHYDAKAYLRGCYCGWPEASPPYQGKPGNREHRKPWVRRSGEIRLHAFHFSGARTGEFVWQFVAVAWNFLILRFGPLSVKCPRGPLLSPSSNSGVGQGGMGGGYFFRGHFLYFGCRLEFFGS